MTTPTKTRGQQIVEKFRRECGHHLLPGAEIVLSQLIDADRMTLEAEVARLRGLFEQILTHPLDAAYNSEFWVNFAREALSHKEAI